MRQIYTADYFTKLDYKNYPFKSKIKIFAKKFFGDVIIIRRDFLKKRG